MPLYLWAAFGAPNQFIGSFMMRQATVPSLHHCNTDPERNSSPGCHPSVQWLKGRGHYADQSTFSQTHKVDNNGINANFIFPYPCSFLQYLDLRM